MKNCEINEQNSIIFVYFLFFKTKYWERIGNVLGTLKFFYNFIIKLLYVHASNVQMAVQRE